MALRPAEDSATPPALAVIADNPRIAVRRGGAPLPNGKAIVYWMQRAQRALDNPALDVAIEVGNELGLPVVAFFSVISTYPNANERHYAFMNQGFPDIQADLAERNVGFVLWRHPNNSLEKFLQQASAAMLVGDENPCREPERWRQVLAFRLRLPFWTVDADVVVPSALFPKRQYALHIFRPRLETELPKFLVAQPSQRARHEWQNPAVIESVSVTEDVTRGWRSFDRSVRPVDTFTGGTHAALHRLGEFIANDLAHYDKLRNHPEAAGTSRLSPYLHFGHISPITIALAVKQAVADEEISSEASESFLGQLIGWRELSINFVKYTEAYDSVECADPWAQKTLQEHARDRRDPLYTLEQMERGETYDELWNASQMQMVKFGWMHNYMRMYWAKKILEWSPNPARAYEYAVTLNDKYELDGRDPNGYAGIAWAMVGKHDRPWFDRPIFGTIRYMSLASTGKKFDSKRYIQNVMGGTPQPDLWA